ncbi:hypothetical protein RHSIM_Rhsim04G0042100 [Rhododendron simsii]|uniref:Uncharacterized protein n=1 Tax=Rhododendron simsii TaxID=118357 RepID=A0A834H5U0_RHOSS|nr:hypothetical protein RHSIM_Rhsim04G0042100 [Rhododendron simsii]
MGNLPPPPDLSFPQIVLFTQTLFFSGIGNSTSLPTKSPRPSSPPTSVPLSSPPSTPLPPRQALHLPHPQGSDFGIGVIDTGIWCRYPRPKQQERLNGEELLRLVPCAKAKWAYLISVMSSEANGLVAVCDLNVYLPLERKLCPFDLDQ